MYNILLAFLASFLSFQNPLPTLDVKSDYDPSQTVAIFNNQELNIPTPEFTTPKVLGDTTIFSNKRIEVDLTTQILTAYEDDRAVGSFLISSGTWNRTPNGTFKIWAKVKSQKMSGGSKELGTYYYLPNVPYILFFYDDKHAKKLGFSIHGAYWHNNFGVPMSHGCINMKTAEAQIIYNWADENTPITIFGKYKPKA